MNDDDVPEEYRHLRDKFSELECDSSCYYCLGRNSDECNGSRRDADASDRYRENLNAAACKFSIFNASDFPESTSFKPFQDLLDEAKKTAKKRFISLEKLRAAKSFGAIRSLIFHCRYPEDETSPSAKLFLPVLILKRCEILIKKPPMHFHYRELLQDMKLLEDKWIDILPPQEHHTFYYLKTFCLIQLKQYQSAKESLNEALECLEESNLLEDIIPARKLKLEKGLRVIEANGCENKQLPQSRNPPPIKLENPNPKYPTFSSAINIYKKSGAYCVKATRDIKPGEVLAVEKAQASFPHYSLSSVDGYTCTHCLKDTLHPLPCPDCCAVIFCSLKCRSAALSTYHKYECKIGWTEFAKLAGVERGTFCMVVRYMMAYPTLFFHHKDYSTLSSGTPPFDPKDSNFFIELINLRLRCQPGPSSQTYFQKMARARLEGFIANAALIQSGYYKDCTDSLNMSSAARKELERAFGIFIRGLILMCDLRYVDLFRLHAKVMDNPVGLYFHSKSQLYGHAVFGLISYIEHSCIGNTTQVTFDGDHMALFAAGSIKKGEEIAYNKGLNPFMPPEERKFRLDELDTNCCCVYCRKVPHIWRDQIRVEIYINSIPSYVSLYEDKESEFIRNKDMDGLLKFRCRMFGEMRSQLSRDEYQEWLMRNWNTLPTQIRRRYQLQYKWN